MTREELWKRAVERLVHVAKSRAAEIERLHPEDHGHPQAANVLATAITIVGAAVIRTCRFGSDPVAALDLAIEGLQQARELMVSRRGVARREPPT